MAVRYFTPKASKVAQVCTATVGGTLAGETFTISVGGVIMATHTDGTTVIADTVAALVAAWNSSTHPYAIGVTATDDSPIVTLTADTPGVPFTPTVNTPGAAATFVLATPTANSGPNVLGLADNWDASAALPEAGDELHFADSAIPICWDLDALNAITFANIYFDMSHTGKLGLNYQVFATSADGSSVNTTVAEYRPTHLELASNGDVYIGGGQKLGAIGASRICLDTLAVACTVEVVTTAATSAEPGRHAVRLRGNNAGTKIYIKDAPGGVGIGTDQPGETCVFDTIEVADNAPLACKVGIGANVTYDGLISAGTCIIWSGPSGVNDVVVASGVLTTQGTGYDIDELTVKEDAVCYCNHQGSNAVSVSAAILHSNGTLDCRGSRKPRTISTIELHPGHLLYHDPDVVTISAVTWATGGVPI